MIKGKPQKKDDWQCMSVCIAERQVKQDLYIVSKFMM